MFLSSQPCLLTTTSIFFFEKKTVHETKKEENTIDIFYTIIEKARILYLIFLL